MTDEEFMRRAIAQAVAKAMPDVRERFSRAIAAVPNIQAVRERLATLPMMPRAICEEK